MRARSLVLRTFEIVVRGLSVSWALKTTNHFQTVMVSEGVRPSRTTPVLMEPPLPRQGILARTVAGTPWHCRDLCEQARDPSTPPDESRANRPAALRMTFLKRGWRISCRLSAPPALPPRVLPLSLCGIPVKSFHPGQ